jgi:ATP-dependent DNA helicase RecQ
MRVLIVAKTRRGTGACVGGMTQHGESVRLIASDAAHNEHAGLEYNVGDVWEVEFEPDAAIIPPHVENIIVHSARRLKQAEDIAGIIERFMPPVSGGPENLFDSTLQHLPSGALFIAERTGVPERSTMFWRPDEALEMDVEGKRIRYRYPTPDGGRLLTFVGFQEPLGVIPAGTLLRVSLAHWWRPSDKPDEELRCHAQLSGWFTTPAAAGVSPPDFPPKPDRKSERIEVRRHDERGADLTQARRILKQTFGFTDFHPLQADVIGRLLQRKDTLVIMPTGGGKSLCYQLPALMQDGLTVVVSPLIALMQDQVSQLRELGVGATFLNSTLSHHEYVATTHRIREGRIRILYVAPETLLRPETLVLLEHSRVRCIAIDEAHCISEWGHDFRPEYRQLLPVRQRFPGAVCAALTATATPRVREDIRRLLQLPADGEFIASFNRPNLMLGVRLRGDGPDQTLAFLEGHRGQSGIIYCSSRKQVDQLAAELRARHWPAIAYHAGMDADSRRKNQEEFLREDAAIMVATVAFGMGINKSNVRFVLHYNLPKDIEGYYQEIGRAGRDGLPADCLLLHSRTDAVRIRKFIEEGAPSERAGRQARLDALIRYAETTGCRRRPLLGYFGEAHEGPCGQCDNCRKDEAPGEQVDVTEAAQKFLSCVAGTGEVYGAAHVIEVLRGSRSQRVLDRRHDRLSTHGTGKERTKEDWRELAQQFIEQGLLEQDLQYGGLRLTAKSHPVLKGERVLVRCKPATCAPRPAKDARAEHDPGLFEALRKLRRELAAQAGMPPYIIFSDRALVEMAAQRPRTPEQFLAINGVGQAKLAHYGEPFLKEIRDYCSAQGTAPSPPPDSAATRCKTTERMTGRRRQEEIGEAFAAGESLETLARRLNLKRTTVLEHLERFVEAGGKADGLQLLSCSRLGKPERERVLRAFKQHGTERLGPIYRALGGSVSYEELRLVRLWMASGQSPR